MNTLTITAISLACSLVTSTTPAVAQADEILVIEKAKDRAGRARIVREMLATRMDLAGEALSAKDINRLLAIAMSNKYNFVAFRKGGADESWPAVDLNLRAATVLNVLGVVQTLGDVKFVYRDGVVIMKPKDEVNELRVLRTYNLRHAVAPLRDRPGPKLGLSGVTDEYFEPEIDDSKTLSGFTIDKIQDVLRNHVEPDSWDLEGTTMSEQTGTLLIRQTESNHKKIEKVLATLGVWFAPKPGTRPLRVRRSRPDSPRRVRIGGFRR